jgi:hypothetical protein
MLTGNMLIESNSCNSIMGLWNIIHNCYEHDAAVVEVVVVVVVVGIAVVLVVN